MMESPIEFGIRRNYYITKFEFFKLKKKRNLQSAQALMNQETKMSHNFPDRDISTSHNFLGIQTSKEKIN